MKIQDLYFEPIERIDAAPSERLRQTLITARRPLILSGLGRDFSTLNSWTLDYFGTIDTVVPAQKPEEDGVNYFFRYFQIPFREFVDRIRRGENLYIGAREIVKDGKASTKDGLQFLADSLHIPDWINKPNVFTANLWVGAGGNRTLLHYDAWDSILMLAEGKKEFFVFPDSESAKMYQTSAFNLVAMYKGKVLHSKIRPLNVQKQYQRKFGTARGFRGSIGPGEVMFIPAGFWHYVESEGLNIAVNFFVHATDRALHKTEPLRTYWIKDNITLWPVRWLYDLRALLFRSIRVVFPKKNRL